MNRLKEICLVSIVTLGGVIGGYLILSCVRSENYHNEIVKIEEIKGSNEREQALSRYEQQFNNTRLSAYIVFGAVGGLIGLLGGLANISSGTSEDLVQSSSDDNDNPRTSGERYMGVG